MVVESPCRVLDGKMGVEYRCRVGLLVGKMGGESRPQSRPGS